jgi:hypothetical protein
MRPKPFRGFNSATEQKAVGVKTKSQLQHRIKEKKEKLEIDWHTANQDLEEFCSDEANTTRTVHTKAPDLQVQCPFQTNFAFSAI